MIRIGAALLAAAGITGAVLAGGGSGSAGVVESIRAISASEADITVNGKVETVLGTPFPSQLSDTTYVDLNQDGEIDRISSAPSESTNLLDAGRTYIRFGPGAAGGGLVSGNLTITGPFESAELQENEVGDVNGDGVPDLILGSPAGRGANIAGSVDIILGPIERPEEAIERSLSADPADIIILDPVLGERFGYSLAVGDVTGDGRNDLIVGAAAVGAVAIFRGPLQPGTRQARDADLIIYDASKPDFGGSVAAGDVTGDGIGDLVVGANAGSGVPVTVTLFQGPLTGSGQQDFANRDQGEMRGTQESLSGGSTAIADLNGDGIGDLIVGIVDDRALDEERRGITYVVPGPFASGEFVNLATRQYVGARAGDNLGSDVSSGDVNGDGILDITIGALNYDPSANETDAGGAFTFFGHPPVIDSVTVEGDLITIAGSEFDPSVYIDGVRTTVLSFSATEIQVRGSGDTVEVRGVFGTASASIVPPPPPPPPTRTVTLARGWNLVGWSGEAVDPEEAAATIAGAFNSLYTWDAAAQRFLSYNPDAPAFANDLRELQTGDGVWINVPSATTWEQPAFTEARAVALETGFNLILWTGPDGTAVTNAVAGLGSALQRLYTWDASGQGYDSYTPGAPAFLNDATTLNHGDGVWMQMSRAASWDQPAASAALLEGALDYTGPYPDPATVSYTADGETVEVAAYPGQVLLFFNTPITEAAAEEIIDDNGGAVLGKVPNAGYYLVGVAPGEEGAFISALTANPALSLALPHLLGVYGSPTAVAPPPAATASAVSTTGVSTTGITIIDDCGRSHGIAVGASAEDAGATNVTCRSDSVEAGGSPSSAVIARRLLEIAGEARGGNALINISSYGGGILGATYDQAPSNVQADAVRLYKDYLTAILTAIDAVPVQDRADLVVTICAGNDNTPLTALLADIRLNGRLADVLRNNVLIVAAPDDVYSLSNDAPGDPDVALLPTASAPFSGGRGTSFSAPRALAIIQQVAQQTGLSGKDALRAAKLAIAANANHILDLEEALAKARDIQREQPPPDGGEEPPPDGEGDTSDPVLAALRDACLAGDMGACDSLFVQAPAGSDLQAVGDTCGNTRPAGSGGTCAGEAVGTGAVQVTLSWGADLADVDLYVTDPSGEQISWRHTSSASGGQLDVDDTNGFGPENIFWPTGGAPSGQYTVEVNLFSTNEATLPIRFTVTVNVGGVAQSFSGTLSAEGQTVIVTTFTVS